MPETDSDFVCDIKAPCFRMLTPEEIELVKASKTQILFRKGDSLTKQGAFTSYILFIVEGLAKQYIESDATKNFNLRIVKPGEFVGLPAVFTKKTFNCSSAALTDCRAFMIEKDTVARLVRENGMFGFTLTKRYFEQQADLLETLNNVIYKHMNGRMAETLLYINGFRDEFPEIFQLLSRKDLADFADITTESAVKLLKTFEKDGLIKLNDKDITILQKGTLLELSKKG